MGRDDYGKYYFRNINTKAIVAFSHYLMPPQVHKCSTIFIVTVIRHFCIFKSAFRSLTVGSL